MRSIQLPVLMLLVWSGVQAMQTADPAAQTDGPETAVNRLEAQLIDNMKAGDSLSFDQRYERLRPLVGEVMAVERMARYLFGRDWRGFDPADREAFADAFLDLSAATYAAQFTDHDGERFESVELRQQSDDRALVRHVLVTSKRRVSFDYLMTRVENDWRIVTIIADGVSDLALKRSQYQRILDDDGFGAVIDYIREQAEKQGVD